MDSRTRYIVGLTLILALTAQIASAQVIEKKSLTIEGARRVVAAAVAEAKKGAGTAAIAVVDDSGNLIAVERLDGTFAAGTTVSIGKARTSVLFKKPTRFFEDLINKGRTAMASLSANEGFTPLQGGIPIVVDGQIVGGVGVSGAASAQQDEEIAIAGANAVVSSSAAPSTTPAVTYFKNSAVAESFAKGAILYAGQGPNYQVHTSRRLKFTPPRRTSSTSSTAKRPSSPAAKPSTRRKRLRMNCAAPTSKAATRASSRKETSSSSPPVFRTGSRIFAASFTTTSSR